MCDPRRFIPNLWLLAAWSVQTAIIVKRSFQTAAPRRLAQTALSVATYIIIRVKMFLSSIECCSVYNNACVFRGTFCRELLRPPFRRAWWEALFPKLASRYHVTLRSSSPPSSFVVPHLGPRRHLSLVPIQSSNHNKPPPPLPTSSSQRSRPHHEQAPLISKLLHNRRHFSNATRETQISVLIPPPPSRGEVGGACYLLASKPLATTSQTPAINFTSQRPRLIAIARLLFTPSTPNFHTYLATRRRTDDPPRPRRRVPPRTTPPPPPP